MTMPAQKPGKSKQDYRTPDNFIEEVKLKFGPLFHDLAAHRENSQCGHHYWGPDSDSFAYDGKTRVDGHVEDSLAVDWNRLKVPDGEWCWLNPPFSKIAPWAKKCAESTIPILFLVPAAVGANWFRDYVHGTAYVYALNGRLDFNVGGPYPKDCMLCVYDTPGLRQDGPGFTVWNWRNE
jgi:phage N-6-adenine-methyltransferase